MKQVDSVVYIVAKEGGQFLGLLGDCEETRCILAELMRHDCIVLVEKRDPVAVHTVPPELTPAIAKLLEELPGRHVAVTGIESPGRG